MLTILLSGIPLTTEHALAMQALLTHLGSGRISWKTAVCQQKISQGTLPVPVPSPDSISVFSKRHLLTSKATKEVEAA